MKASEKVMSRVMKLLKVAGDPNATESERALAGEHAERMMAQHMIDRMDLTEEEKTEIVKDTWDLATGEAGTKYSYHVKELMEEVLRHCGIRVNPKQGYGMREDGRPDYGVRRFTIVGFPEDLAYAEAIWFRVYKEFVGNINPQWDPSKSLEDNVYLFVKAGFSWIDTYRIGRKAEHVEWPEEMPNGAPLLRRAYKRALDERGEEFTKTRRREAYRDSFVKSYSSTIGTRLFDLRRKAKEYVADEDKFALALRSTKERVDEEFYRLFPEYDPEVRRKMQEAQDFELACAFAALPLDEQERLIKQEAERIKRENAAWERSSKRAKGNYRRVREYDDYEPTAWARGASVANRVNLNNDGEVKEDKKGELE